MAGFLDDPAAINLYDLSGEGSAFASAFVQRANSEVSTTDTVDELGQPINERLKRDLLEAFEALEEIGAEFGFRTAKEISRYVTIHRELSGADWQYKAALDAQVLQKLMPKLHGSARKLEGVLDSLAEFAKARALALTGEKIARMQKRLDRDGFTSFAEA